MSDSSEVNKPIDQQPALLSAPDRSPAPIEPFDALRSTTRLLVGLALVGSDELLKRLQMLEHTIDTQPFDRAEMQAHIRTSPTGQHIPDDIRYALIGLAFELQDQVRVQTPRLLAAADQIISDVTRPAQSVLNHLPIVGPLSRTLGLQYDAMQKRGEDRLRRWIAIGQREEARSRVLADQTFTRIVDDVIDYLADKPEVQDLIAGQTTGLAGEVLNEVRERTVSGDSFLEGIVRAVLRKAPRAELPPPSMEIRQSAVKVPERPLVAGSVEKGDQS
ncbi:MAG TPA: hypothetical protein VMP08_25095 [Anaerolineae bacterium]|nr:hypothetical protein [Anaerolineae bacterium]